jgi:hypothetical protein
MQALEAGLVRTTLPWSGALRYLVRSEPTPRPSCVLTGNFRYAEIHPYVEP